MRRKHLLKTLHIIDTSLFKEEEEEEKGRLFIHLHLELRKFLLKIFENFRSLKNVIIYLNIDSLINRFELRVENNNFFLLSVL